MISNFTQLLSTILIESRLSHYQVQESKNIKPTFIQLTEKVNEVSWYWLSINFERTNERTNERMAVIIISQ